MRDNQNRLAVFPHLPENRKEALGLLRGQHGSRLIENQDVRAAVQNLHNLDGLLLGDRELVDLLLRIQPKAVALREFRELLLRRLQVVFAAPLAEDDILGRTEHRNQLEVLVYHADAEPERILRGLNARNLAVYFDLSAVRKIDAGEHIHERRLAAPVFPEERQYLSLLQRKTHAVARRDFAEALGNLAKLNCVFCHSFLLKAAGFESKSLLPSQGAFCGSFLN